MLKNDCTCQYGVKIHFKMLIYWHKLCLVMEFCLVLAALMTFFNTLSVLPVDRNPDGLSRFVPEQKISVLSPQ